MVWGSRPDGACDFVSRRWLEYSGVSESELLGYGWLERVHPEEREQLRERWRSAVRTGQDFDAEFRNLGASGSYRWFFTRAAPMRNGRAQVVRWYGTSTDIDELKRSEPARDAVVAAET